MPTSAAQWSLIGIYFLVALVVAGLISIAPGAFTRKRPTKEKLESYECGVPPTSGMLGRFAVQFYLVAMLFVVFDVETASFYPWAVKLKQLGFLGYFEMLTFIVVLGIGYAYVWKKGGFSWR